MTSVREEDGSDIFSVGDPFNEQTDEVWLCESAQEPGTREASNVFC